MTTTTTITTERFTSELLIILTQAFEDGEGYFLDPGTSIFETLETVSAEEASRPVSATCTNIAAQVNHITFYLNVIEEYYQTREWRPQDWAGSWRIGSVNQAEWDQLITNLRETYTRLRGHIQQETWEEPQALAGAIGMVAHCAYHLGEIRQALCTVRVA